MYEHILLHHGLQLLQLYPNGISQYSQQHFERSNGIDVSFQYNRRGGKGRALLPSTKRRKLQNGEVEIEQSDVTSDTVAVDNFFVNQLVQVYLMFQLNAKYSKSSLRQIKAPPTGQSKQTKNTNL